METPKVLHKALQNAIGSWLCNYFPGRTNQEYKEKLVEEVVNFFIKTAKLEVGE